LSNYCKQIQTKFVRHNRQGYVDYTQLGRKAKFSHINFAQFFSAQFSGGLQRAVIERRRPPRRIRSRQRSLHWILEVIGPGCFTWRSSVSLSVWSSVC